MSKEMKGRGREGKGNKGIIMLLTCDWMPKEK
jgi:hypothetical protein